MTCRSKGASRIFTGKHNQEEGTPGRAGRGAGHMGGPRVVFVLRVTAEEKRDGETSRLEAAER